MQRTADRYARNIQSSVTVCVKQEDDRQEPSLGEQAGILEVQHMNGCEIGVEMMSI